MPNSTRRDFLKIAALSPIVLANSPNSADNSSETGPLSIKPVLAASPVVISTWDFGKAANEAAWQVLAQNGRSIDAVEAGVKIPEADPNVTSVGYGGLPDRDGKVTLDACIMDENGKATRIQAYLHHVSDFTREALAAGFQIERLDEWWGAEDAQKTPRLLTLLLNKRAATSIS